MYSIYVSVLGIFFAASHVDASPVSFRDQIVPILQTHCLGCHSGAKAKGELDLTTRKSTLRGGTNGVVLIPGSANKSRLIHLVRKQKMPPKKPLDPSAVELLQQWVDEGAVWDGADLVATRGDSNWWSLQPVRRPAIPSVANPEWCQNPIDVFIYNSQARAKLTPSPDADRRTFIRRVTLDLTGLWPTPEEVDAFLNDQSPDAKEKLVDRLLASPAYGERWGRHWLDVVRFAESTGFEVNNPRMNAWGYRDYIIRSFSRDVPYRQFVREQLAGDTMAGADELTQCATGFLVGGAHDQVGNQTEEGTRQIRSDDLFDMVSTTSATFLGLTVGCARCHDHKFDPISQRDFYALEAMFAGVQHGERPIQTPDSKTREAEAAEIQQRLTEIDRSSRADRDVRRPKEDNKTPS